MEQTASRSVCVCEDADISMTPPIFFPFLYRQTVRTIPPRTQRASGISYGKTRKHVNSCNEKGHAKLEYFFPNS
jgi:hypothetical protein